jgi:hypothetical protein
VILSRKPGGEIPQEELVNKRLTTILKGGQGQQEKSNKVKLHVLSATRYSTEV